MSEQTTDPAANVQATLVSEQERKQKPTGWWSRLGTNNLFVTFLAFVTAMLIGGILIGRASCRERV